MDVGEGQGHFRTTVSLYTLFVITLQAELLTLFGNSPPRPFPVDLKQRQERLETVYQGRQFQPVLFVSKPFSINGLLSL